MGLQYVHPEHHRTMIPDEFPVSPVEGEPPGPMVQRVERRVLVAGSIAAFAAAIAIGYAFGGPRGMIVGLTVFGAYFLLGWWPYFAAAHYRRQSHED